MRPRFALTGIPNNQISIVARLHISKTVTKASESRRDGGDGLDGLVGWETVDMSLCSLEKKIARIQDWVVALMTGLLAQVDVVDSFPHLHRNLETGVVENFGCKL